MNAGSTKLLAYESMHKAPPPLSDDKKTLTTVANARLWRAHVVPTWRRREQLEEDVESSLALGLCHHAVLLQ